MESMSKLAEIIKKSVENDTPDCLSNIMSRLNDHQSIVQKPKKHFNKVFCSVLASAIGMACIGFGVYYFFINTSKLNAQILKYYVPFHADQIGDDKYPEPHTPSSYHELEGRSNDIILGTIKEIGVYRNASDSHNSKASFGIYIYTVKIDHVIKGQIANNQNILVKETALAYLENKKFKFTPYSTRPDKYGNLAVNKQYVLFCSNKDKTGCYGLSSDGFGVFAKEYIDSEFNIDSLTKLEKQYNSEAIKSPLKGNLLYRICALNIKLPD